MLLKQYYIILFIAITSRSCNGPAVRIKLSKPRGKIWLKTKTKTKNIYSKEKTAQPRVEPIPFTRKDVICQTTAPHCKNKVRWKIIIQSIIFVKFCQQTLFEAVVAVFIMNSKTNLRKISYNYFLLLLLTFRPPFPPKIFLFVSSERDVHRTTSPTSIRRWNCQKHSHYGVFHKQNHIHSRQIKCLQRGSPQGLASNSEPQAMMTEMEFIHLLRR